MAVSIGMEHLFLVSFIFIYLNKSVSFCKIWSIWLCQVFLLHRTGLLWFLLHPWQFVSQPLLIFTGVVMEARSRCHKANHKGKKEAFFSCNTGSTYISESLHGKRWKSLLRLVRSIYAVFGLIALCIERGHVLLLYNYGRMEFKHCHIGSFVEAI